MTSGDGWGLRGSVRMSSMRRTSIPSFATLHEVNVDEIQLNLLDGQFLPSSSSSSPLSASSLSASW